jgi:hypothetical protein
MLSRALCIGAGEFVPETVSPGCLESSDVALEPSGEHFVVVRIDSAYDALVDVRRRIGVVEELRLRPADSAGDESIGWVARGDIYFDSVLVVGDPFGEGESFLDTIDVRPGRYVVETSALDWSRMALRARWWREA